MKSTSVMVESNDNSSVESSLLFSVSFDGSFATTFDVKSLFLAVDSLSFARSYWQASVIYFESYWKYVE